MRKEIRTSSSNLIWNFMTQSQVKNNELESRLLVLPLSASGVGFGGRGEEHDNPTPSPSPLAGRGESPPTKRKEKC
jgi:hypothetical protein